MHGAIDRVILSLGRIWRGADMYVVPEMVPLRARSFRTEVLQDDAGVLGRQQNGLCGSAHERGRSRLHFLHGFRGDAVADVPEFFIEQVLHALVQDLYRRAHGADDSAADDSLG